MGGNSNSGRWRKKPKPMGWPKGKAHSKERNEKIRQTFAENREIRRKVKLGKLPTA